MPSTQVSEPLPDSFTVVRALGGTASAYAARRAPMNLVPLRELFASNPWGPAGADPAGADPAGADPDAPPRRASGTLGP